MIGAGEDLPGPDTGRGRGKLPDVLDIERDEELRREANRSLARQAAGAVVLNPAACLLLGYAGGLHQRSPLPFFSLLAVTLLAAAARGFLILRFDGLYRRSAERWQRLHAAAVLAGVLALTAISCWAFFEHGITGVTSFGFLACAVLCNMAIVVYTSDLALVRLVLLGVLLPHVAVFLWTGGTALEVIAPVSLAYGAYLWIAGNRLHRGYWQARSDARLLKLRARELEEARETRERAESNYQRIFDNAHDAILIFEPADERVLNVNRRACEIYGFPREEFVGLSLADISRKAGDEQGHVEKTVRSGTHYSFETVQYRKDGSEMVLEVQASVFQYQGEQAILSINRDVTDRKRAEQELRHHRRHLEELVRERTARLEEAVTDLEAKNAEMETKNAEMERFTYTISHDLKSPLITIRGFLGLLEKDVAAGDSGRVQTDTARIRAATGHMARLLDELLELSRIGRIVNAPREVPLGELGREAVALVGGAITERGVEVEVAGDLPVVSGDRPRLLEVFQNLIENAVRFLGEQPAPRIEIGVRPAAGETRSTSPVVYVRDNGIGIETRYQEKIFGLFERLDLSIEGTGIGLALVKRIVEVHGGRIWVESEGEGRGSAFCFTLGRTPSLVESA